MKGHFAYLPTYLLCGGCGSAMPNYVPPIPIDNEYTLRVYCSNPICPNYLEVFEPSDKVRVALLPTKLRAPDPALALAGTAQATNAGILGGAGPGPIGPFPRAITDYEARIMERTPTWVINETLLVDNPRETAQVRNVNVEVPIVDSTRFPPGGLLRR